MKKMLNYNLKKINSILLYIEYYLNNIYILRIYIYILQLLFLLKLLILFTFLISYLNI